MNNQLITTITHYGPEYVCAKIRGRELYLRLLQG
jgi:hypothetical protein